MVIIVNSFCIFIHKTLFVNVFIDDINLRRNGSPFYDMVFKWPKTFFPIYVNIQSCQSNFLKGNLVEIP